MLTRLIFASLLSDFALQPDALVAWKKRSFTGLVVHTGIVLIASFLVGYGFWSRPFVILVLTLSAVHLAIDYAKVRFDLRWNANFWPIASFLTDQVLHLASVVILTTKYGFASSETVKGLVDALSADSRYLAVGSAYLASVLSGSVVVRLVIQSFSTMQGADRPGLLRAGAYIGMVERFLITSLVALGQYGAVGFVLAAKSVARYKQIETIPEFAEYYLIGTLTSSTIGVMGGLLVKLVLR